MAATRTDIINTFLSTNTKEPSDGSRWDVDDDTYINYVPLTIDRDYDMGYLLEVVERSTSVVSFLVVVTFGGPDRDGRWDYDGEWWPEDVGTFFDRKVDISTVSQWAVGKVYGLMDSWRDRREASRREVCSNG